MTDLRILKLAQILAGHSVQVKPGDRIAIEATTAAEPLVRALYGTILELGGNPYLLLDLPEQDEILFKTALDEQLEHTPILRKKVYDEFEGRIRVHSAINPRALTGVDPARQKRRQKALASILETQMRRGADRSFKWVTTIFPTEGYAKEAGMSLQSFGDYVYRACGTDEADPVEYWKKIEQRQREIIERLEGHDRVSLRGPNVDLSLSIKGRRFVNGAGLNNMPDGEIFTGPVEESLNGWVRYSYPAIYNGAMVEGVELTFHDGKVVKARADKNEPLLLEMIESDPGARYVGEFAIGTNYAIDQFSHNILLDEKIGGSFHLALGAGYPETGSKNKSVIHWDMICGMKEDAEILVDGEKIYQNGNFILK